MSAHDNLRGHVIVSHVIFITADWLTFVSALTNLTPFQDIDRIICGILAILSVCICKCVCVCVWENNNNETCKYRDSINSDCVRVRDTLTVFDMQIKSQTLQTIGNISHSL